MGDIFMMSDKNISSVMCSGVNAPVDIESASKNPELQAVENELFNARSSSTNSEARASKTKLYLVLSPLLFGFCALCLVFYIKTISYPYLLSGNYVGLTVSVFMGLFPCIVGIVISSFVFKDYKDAYHDEKHQFKKQKSSIDNLSNKKQRQLSELKKSP